MLTTEDLQKIGDLIDRRMDIRFSEFENTLDEKLEQKLEQKLEEKLDQKLDQKLAPIKKDIRIIKADLRTTIKFFDDDINGLKKRVGRIEEYIGINN